MAAIKYLNENGEYEEVAVGGGGGSTPADLYPSEYSDEFNDDFTN